MPGFLKKATLLAGAAVALLSLNGCQKEDGKIHVELGMWPAAQQTSDVAMFNIWKQRFEADHPEYVIEPANYEYAQDTVAVGAMSGTLPTVFQTWFTEPSMLIEQGYIRDVTDLVKEVGYYDDMDPFMRETLEDEEGNLYGIPRDGYGFGMLLNLRSLTYYGLIEGDIDEHEYVLYDESGDPLYPTTYAELADWAELITTNSGGDCRGTMFYSANRQGGWLFSNIAWNFGAELMTIDTGGAPHASLNEDAVVEALQYIAGLRSDGYLVEGTSFVYNDWYSSINERMAIAFCGSDVIQNAVTQGSMDRNDIAFVPMPAGPGGDRYSLYGGTPFVFAANATDEEVRGALLFLEYMGRSPVMSEAQKTAMVEGKQTSLAKNEPILPSIRPWTNEEYNSYADELDGQYVNVNQEYFDDFFDTIGSMRKEEVPYEAQKMYDYLDQAVSAVLTNPNMGREEIKNQLTTLNQQFERDLAKYA